MPEIDVAELAGWLEEHARDVLWSVDGEERLAGDLWFPCTGDDLAEALRARGGRLRVEPPADAALREAVLNKANIEAAAELEDGAHIFRLAWISSEGADEPWFLIEDTIVKSASQ